LLREHAERGYSRLLPFPTVEWEICFSQAQDCAYGQAGARGQLSPCPCSGESCVGHRSLSSQPGSGSGTAAKARLLGERLLGLCSGHGVRREGTAVVETAVAFKQRYCCLGL